MLKMFAFFSKQDQRTWTILVNPGQASVFITCYQTGLGEFSFELNDGGQYIPRNFSIKTDSIEVIVEYLITHGVTQHEDYPGRYKFISQQINTYSAKKAENTDLPVNSSGEKDNSSVTP